MDHRVGSMVLFLGSWVYVHIFYIISTKRGDTGLRFSVGKVGNTYSAFAFFFCLLFSLKKIVAVVLH